MSIENDDEWITIGEVAQRFGVTHACVHNWVRTGKIQSKKTKKYVLISVSSLKKAVEESGTLGRRGRPTAFAISLCMPEPAKPHEPMETRIESRIKKETGANGCWIWTGGIKDRKPFFQASKREGISVRSWLFHHHTGRTGVGFHAACGNNLCVRPEHMGIINAEIPLVEVPKIRKRWALNLAHRTTLEQIGKEYGVSRQRIEQIVRDVAAIPCSCVHELKDWTDLP